MNTEQASARLVTELVAAGSLGDDWRLAFEQVPRHVFIPDIVYQLDRSDAETILCRCIGRTNRTSSWSSPMPIRRSRWGAEKVVTVEIDPAVAWQAPRSTRLGSAR